MTLPEKAEEFVFDLLKDKLSALYTYHNFEHTTRVSAAAAALASVEKITGDEQTALQLACWFHDTGYVFGPEEHELKSASIFEGFADENEVPENIRSLAKSLILATDMRKEPKTLLENIIRDADCAHFGDENYESIASRLRMEWEAQGRVYTDAEWRAGNIEMLTKWHRFRTQLALSEWQPQKERNIDAIKEKLQQMDSEEEKKKHKKKDKKQKKDKEKKPDRGIETMFRVTLNNHTQLSQIADSKANILLSVNAIIISIALSTLIPKLDSPSNAHLVTPTFILLAFSVVSIIFAILATRPKINSSNYDAGEVAKRNVNLLFFGNFSKMPIADFQLAMKDMMQDRNYLYESLIRDLYLLGKVLDRKYKLLRITYNIFMTGIIVSVIAFVIAFKFY